MTKKQYSTPKLSVGTVKESKAVITSRWFCRNACQRCTFDLSGWRFRLLQIARHGGFGNLKSELLQVPMDARRAPGWILGLHAPNQPLYFHADARATKAFRPRSPSPEQAKPSTMPGHHSIWLYDDQGIRPPRPQTAKGDPKCPVKIAKVRPRLFPLEHDQLLAQ